MKKAYRVHIDLDIRVVADNVKSLSNRNFKKEVIEMAFDEIKQHPEEYCDFDNVASVEEDKKAPYKGQMFWAIFNGKDERLFQYGFFHHVDYAAGALAKAKEKYPDAYLQQVEL